MSKLTIIDIDPPESLTVLSGKSVNQVYTFSPEALEVAILEALRLEESYRKQSAIWDLRAGVLFQIYRQSLQVTGRKYSGFWQGCEDKFGVSRMTISKKMRLAVIWAKEQGATAAHIQSLAEAANLDSLDDPAIQLAFDWIGDNTTSDLYRKYKLVKTGPQGGDVTPRNEEGQRIAAPKRTKDQIAREEFEIKSRTAADAALSEIRHLLKLKGPKGEPGWAPVSAQLFAELKAAAHDLHSGMVDTEKTRAALQFRGKKK